MPTRWELGFDLERPGVTFHVVDKSSTIRVITSSRIGLYLECIVV